MNEQEIISINNYLIDAFKSHNIAVKNEKNGWINFPRRNDAPFYAYQTRQPKIRGEVVDRKQHPNNLVVQIDVSLLLPDGRILCESFAGIGEDEKSAIGNGLTNFLSGSFHVLINAFYFQPNDEQVSVETWKINGEKWRAFLGNLVGRGEASAQMPDDVFPTLENLIKSKKLEENCHWFRFFYANLENETMECELLFDNKPWKDAADKLKNCSWEKRDEYYTFRNFLVLVNEDYYASKNFILDGKNCNDFSEKLIGAQLKNFIATAVELFRKHQDLEESDLLKVFVENGIPLDISRRLIEFLPTAYARVFLGNSDINFTEYYERIDIETGEAKVIEKRKLTDNPIYIEAFRFAQEELNYDYDKDDFWTIAGRSAEMQAINNLLNQGSNLEDITFTPLGLTWEDNSQSDFYKIGKYSVMNEVVEDSEAKKSWWQIWK